ncbi:hypothetical protein CALCODRAFT_230198 [Calocera cornea HHB12733]|uniref:Uncharacterized protein n=1 Tax=Calocera cornea HHB12733 TaxID=1353952 RepID=A0A165GYQ5_9BASI|nr:hypothetical protein CALCODRAFT_230198 [Calocera cornea HHB12733]
MEAMISRVCGVWEARPDGYYHSLFPHHPDVEESWVFYTLKSADQHVHAWYPVKRRKSAIRYLGRNDWTWENMKQASFEELQQYGLVWCEPAADHKSAEELQDELASLEPAQHISPTLGFVIVIDRAMYHPAVVVSTCPDVEVFEPSPWCLEPEDEEAAYDWGEVRAGYRAEAAFHANLSTDTGGYDDHPQHPLRPEFPGRT